MKELLRQLTIRQRVLLGFGSISILLIVVGGVTLWGLWRMNDFFRRFDEANRQASLQIDIDRSTSLIQRHVVRFMHEGYPSAGESALDLMDSLRDKLKTAMEHAMGSPSLQVTLKEMDGHLDIYEETFRAAMVEKQLTTSLIREELPRLWEDLEVLIKAYHTLPGITHPDVHELTELANARASILTYFESLDSRMTYQSRQHLDTLSRHIREKKREDPPAYHDRIDEIAEGVLAYDRAINRAIQATRGYLFLINVVMSGEASEILFKAQQLGQAGEARKATLRTGLDHFLERINRFIIGMIALSILIGLLQAIVLGRQIVLPLGQIKDTFQALSRGEKDAVIPPYRKADEIGDLVKAANVFKDRNAQTEVLLQQAQSLTTELEQKQEALRRSNEEMEQFVFTVSHDLKSPIVTSMGFIGIIRDLARAGRMEEAVQKLDRIEQANTRMGLLINDLLELSRVGRIDMEPAPVDMGPFLEQVKESLAPVLREAAFSLELNGPFPTVFANPNRVLQVFENLIGNAIKYGKSQDNLPNRIEISCRTEATRNRHVFLVRDYGIGVPPEFREKVFGLFMRLDTKSEGTGIGLAVVRKLMLLHGGEAWMESPNGPGALFCIALPIPQFPSPNL